MILKVGPKQIRVESSGYVQAKARFDEILRTKLGVSPAKMEAIKPSAMHVRSVSHAHANPQNITETSSSTAADVDKAFKGTALEGLGTAFKKAEKDHGVNVWFLAALAALESGFGTSQIAKNKNNLFGFNAYDDSPYESASSFSDRESGIGYVASFISKEYLQKDGSFFNGFSVDAVGKRYATDPQWANKVSKLMNDLSTKAMREGTSS